MHRKSLLAVAGLFVSLVAPPQARAAYIVNIYQSGANVVLEGSGAITLDGLDFRGVGTVPEGLFIPNEGIIIGGPGQGVVLTVDTYATVTAAGSFGTGAEAVRDSSTFTSSVGLYGDLALLWVPTGFKGGALPSGSMTFNNQTIASLGLTEGSYAWTWGSEADDQQFIVNVGNVGSSAIPESSSLALSGCGMGLLALVMWKRKRAVQIPSSR
jgi:hypothetical protein